MKLLKILVIVSIVSLIITLGYLIYDNFIITAIYNSNSTGVIENDKEKYELCRKALEKYILSVNEDEKNISSFFPLFKAKNDEIKVFKKNINNLQRIRTDRLFKLSNNVYMIEYTIHNFNDKFYKCIIKFYPSKNYYKIIYDELYETKKEVNIYGEL